MWSYYSWLCRPLVNIICGVIMIGFIVVVVLSVYTICGGIMVGFVVVVRQ